jgi:hypothetical protein
MSYDTEPPYGLSRPRPQSLFYLIRGVGTDYLNPGWNLTQLTLVINVGWERFKFECRFGAVAVLITHNSVE